jgi:hypothetical protein
MANANVFFTAMWANRLIWLVILAVRWLSARSFRASKPVGKPRKEIPRTEVDDSSSTSASQYGSRLVFQALDGPLQVRVEKLDPIPSRTDP